MSEEAEALVHSSKGMNRALKLLLTISLVFVLSLVEFGVVNAVIDGLSSIDIWIAMLFDSVSLTFPLMGLGLYTSWPFQAVQIIGSLPFLLMIFLSTTFSPGMYEMLRNTILPVLIRDLILLSYSRSFFRRRSSRVERTSIPLRQVRFDIVITDIFLLLLRNEFLKAFTF